MYEAKNTSTAHTQTAAQNQLIMAAKVAYDVLFIASREFIHHIIDGMSFLKTTESMAV